MAACLGVGPEEGFVHIGLTYARLLIREYPLMDRQLEELKNTGMAGSNS